MATDIAERTTESTTRRLLLMLIVLVSYGRVVWELGAKNLWWDESLSLQRAESALLPLLKGHLVIQDGFSQLLTIDQHPFMFFLLEGGLIRLAGDSEFSLRYVSAMAATLLPAVLWVLARWFVRRRHFPAVDALLGRRLCRHQPVFPLVRPRSAPLRAVGDAGAAQHLPAAACHRYHR